MQQQKHVEIYRKSLQIRDYDGAYEALIACQYPQPSIFASCLCDYAHVCCENKAIAQLVYKEFPAPAAQVMEQYLETQARLQPVPAVTDFTGTLNTLLSYHEKGRKGLSK